jgi:hypothetical protein
MGTINGDLMIESDRQVEFVQSIAVSMARQARTIEAMFNASVMRKMCVDIASIPLMEQFGAAARSLAILKAGPEFETLTAQVD